MEDKHQKLRNFKDKHGKISKRPHDNRKAQRAEKKEEYKKRILGNMVKNFAERTERNDY